MSGLNTAATLWCTAAVGALTGLGFLVQAALGVAGILSENVVLRPIAMRINRQPFDGTDVVSSYEIRATCRQAVEEHLRTVLIGAIRGNATTLRALYSDDVEATERVEVVVDVTIAGRAETRLERIVGRIGVEPGASAVSWKIVPTDDEERNLLPEA